MEKYIPDIYQKNIYSINYDNLISRGIKYLLFDLDNTIAPITEKRPSESTINLFRFLKNKNFKIMIISNSLEGRVSTFAKELKVDYISNAKKPSNKKLLKVVKDNSFDIDKTAIIGDSMLDDVVVGNSIGITTVLTDQLDKHEFPFARLKRFKERRIQIKLRDNNLFTKGRYYE
ncbi:MAG: HAD-IIIA family hydrolase [Bacilli bacterium]|nr:HAD-IIIA family hydrolase [Bacilli bacterium]